MLQQKCQVLMMLMKSDLLPYLEAVASETLDTLPDPEFYDGSAITVVMCSGGYPEEYEKGFKIDWGTANKLYSTNLQVFHAGTKWEGDRCVTDGGRVLNVTAKGKTLQDTPPPRICSVISEIPCRDFFYEVACTEM